MSAFTATLLVSAGRLDGAMLPPGCGAKAQDFAAQRLLTWSHRVEQPLGQDTPPTRTDPRWLWVDFVGGEVVNVESAGRFTVYVYYSNPTLPTRSVVWETGVSR